MPPRPVPPRPAARSRRPAYRRIAESDPRRVAFDVQRAVAERDAYANLALPGLLRERRLSGRDAAFATELAYGTLRARGQLDAVLAACVDRPLTDVDPAVLDLLRLGAYQLLRTNVATHAAVSATIDLARTVLTHGQVGFANAVLRRVAESDLDTWLARVAPDRATDPVGHLAIRHSHPAWIVRAFRDALGGDLDETAAALSADDARPAVHLVTRPGRVERSAVLAEVDGSAGPWSPYAVHLAGGDPGRLAGVRAGQIGVQDEGSQLVALALAGATDQLGPGPDRWWVDLCAGPGGKAGLLGDLAAQRDRDTAVVAVELAPHRARLVAQTVAGTPATPVIADGTVPPFADGTLDRVLVDAPCTGLGALRRRPEARWRRVPTDVPELAALQRRLLTAALRAVRPGGLVAYATCSPHLAETLVVVGEVLRREPAEQLDARALFPGLPDLGPGPHVQLWPHRHGTDAMFFALLRRQGPA